MFREPDVDDVAPVLDALFRKGFREQTEVVQLCQPADDVVSDAKIVQCFVQFREPGVHPIEQCHDIASLYILSSRIP